MAPSLLLDNAEPYGEGVNLGLHSKGAPPNVGGRAPNCAQSGETEPPYAEQIGLRYDTRPPPSTA
jgi:hypothetical protein